MGDTITSKFFVEGEPYQVVTTRNTGESDENFINRHCRDLFAAIQAVEDSMSCMSIFEEDLNIETERIPSTLPNAAFVDLHRDDLLEAA